MERIDSDYVVPENDDFETVPDGQYTAEELEWFTVDEKTERPILVEQKDGRMVARARIKTSEGKEPPVSADLSQYKLLVMAFGGDLNELPAIPQLNDPDGISTYLEQVEVQCSNGSKTPKFRVSNGWANVGSFQGALPPKGNYSWRVDHFEPVDDNGQPILEESKKFPGSYYFYLYAELVGDGMGNPSPYSGLVLSNIVSYKVEVDEKGNPRWTTIKSGPHAGKYTGTGKDFALFVDAIAPSWFEGVPVADANNILPELLETAKKDNMVFAAFGQATDKGFWNLMIDTAVPLSSSPKSVKGAETGRVKSGEDTPPPTDLIEEVVSILAKVEGVDQAFKDNGSLDVTPECVPVLKKYLTPAKEAGIINAGRLELITDSQLLAFLQQLPLGDLPSDAGEKLVKITTHLTQNKDNNNAEKDGPLF